MIIDLSTRPRRLATGIALAILSSALLFIVLRPDDHAGTHPRNTNASGAQPPASQTATARSEPVGGRILPRGMPNKPVDRRSANAVTIAFSSRMELIDTAVDDRPGDAYRRAAAFATPHLQHQLLKEADAPVKDDDYVWNHLVDKHGWTTVTTRLGGLGPPPPDTTKSASRDAAVTVIEHGDGNWQAPVPGRTVYVLGLKRTQTGWAVDSYQKVAA